MGAILHCKNSFTRTVTKRERLNFVSAGLTVVTVAVFYLFIVTPKESETTSPVILPLGISWDFRSVFTSVEHNILPYTLYLVVPQLTETRKIDKSAKNCPNTTTMLQIQKITEMLGENISMPNTLWHRLVAMVSQKGC